jgi:Universal stress protein family
MTPPTPAPSGSNPASLVVVGVDDSPQAQAALVWAAGHAQRTGARVLAVAAWSPPAQMVRGPEIDADALVTGAFTTSNCLPAISNVVLYGPTDSGWSTSSGERSSDSISHVYGSGDMMTLRGEDG